jgi:hypothetical protein
MDASVKHSRFDAIGMMACLAIALGLRLAVIAIRPNELTVDRDAYLGIATGVAEGRGFSSPGSLVPTAFRPPFYPICLGAGLTFFYPSAAVGGINVIAGLLTVWLIGRLGDCLNFGPRRLLAALIVAIDPLLVWYTCQPMTESMCTLLATFWLWTMIAPAAGNHQVYLIKRFLNGLSFGFLVLCRPTFWLIAAFYVLAWFKNPRQLDVENTQSKHTSYLPGWVASSIAVVCVVGPWLIRNWIVFGVPILTTTHGGYTLLLGNNPVFYQEVVEQRWGIVWQHDSLLNWQTSLESMMAKDLGDQASEVDRDRWYSKQARKYMLATPRLFAAAVVHRVRSLWNIVPQGDVSDQTGGWALSAIGWFYSLILTAGMIGLVMISCSPNRNKWFPLFVLIASVQMAHLFYWTNTRMRAPLTPAIALFAVVAIPRKL